MPKGKKSLSRRIFLRRYLSFIIPLVILVGLFYYYILRDLPSPTILSSNSYSQSTQIYDRNNTLLYTIYGNKNQTFIPLSGIPKTVQHATISVEDKDFYNHGPIDFRGIARAFIATVFHQRTEGGSTITQQLVKNTLLSPERTLLCKAREVVLSFATELLYPKDKILEMYLNQIPYGGTAYGIEAASQTYFGKNAKDLDIAQSALLAGLPESPTQFSPFGANAELAKDRQRVVLKDMYEQKYISQSQYNTALNEPLTYLKLSNKIKAPHFVFYIKDLLIKKYGEKVVQEGGLKVRTSLDIPIQDYAQASVSAEVADLKGYHVSNGAAVVTNPATGEILAMVGSTDYDNAAIDGNVNVTTRLRQPGSSIKPINYAVGLIHGYNAATAFIDQATCFPNGTGQNSYCPVNYDGKFHGIVQMRYALGNSFNIPAVKMLKVNGVESMIATASAMGITTFGSPDTYGLSLTLGGGEVRMIDMAQAYGVFANGGYRIDLHPILKVTDKNKQKMEEYIPPPSPIFCKKILPPGVAFIMSDILQDNGARLTEFGPASGLYIKNKIVSAKTGTTDDKRDNWAIGYTPSYVVATWVGNDNNQPMGAVASGITGAAPIFHD